MSIDELLQRAFGLQTKALGVRHVARERARPSHDMRKGTPQARRHRCATQPLHAADLVSREPWALLLRRAAVPLVYLRNGKPLDAACTRHTQEGTQVWQTRQHKRHLAHLATSCTARQHLCQRGHLPASADRPALRTGGPAARSPPWQRLHMRRIFHCHPRQLGDADHCPAL